MKIKFIKHCRVANRLMEPGYIVDTELMAPFHADEARQLVTYGFAEEVEPEKKAKKAIKNADE